MTAKKPKTSVEKFHSVERDVTQFGQVRFRPSLLITKPQIETICKDYVEWACTTKYARVTSFMILQGVTPKTFYEWIKKFPELKEADEMVRAILLERRELRALDGTWNAGYVLATLPLLCPEYAEWKRSMLKGSGSEQTIKLMMEPMPSSDVVVPHDPEGSDSE